MRRLPDSQDPIVIDEANDVFCLPSEAVVYSSRDYTRNFTQSDLTMGWLPLPHNLSSQAIAVALYNNLGYEVKPSDIVAIDNNNASVSLEGYTPITSTWKIKAI
jgi:hypothetical protein